MFNQSAHFQIPSKNAIIERELYKDSLKLYHLLKLVNWRPPFLLCHQNFEYLHGPKPLSSMVPSKGIQIQVLLQTQPAEIGNKSSLLRSNSVINSSQIREVTGKFNFKVHANLINVKMPKAQEESEWYTGHSVQYLHQVTLQHYVSNYQVDLAQVNIDLKLKLSQIPQNLQQVLYNVTDTCRDQVLSIKLVWLKQILLVLRVSQIAISIELKMKNSLARNSNSHYRIDDDHQPDPFLPGVAASTGNSQGQGEISNIEKLYKKVVSEFSIFSKNITEKAPKAKGGLQDFLSMFDQDKHDPSQQEENKEDDVVIVNDYIIYEKGDIMRTEGYYVTKAAQVKGNFRFTRDYLQFEAVKCAENNTAKDEDYLI